ncbi:cytochrome b5, putative [Trypanosoma brucei gambiense DAL972]|uniref:Cytochrome b5, putative n=1 Tax=Trypanosoma brucei gambiense (strain MHOM/CI/86/DAL972) TaxID=679716 RepID=C9ZL21_TRYB9|nr:cytochrome b5, putative [Trypanosoma brucei gambiense DAL972]CBH10030.1 cytochrome b5, putative [Trypanosoma brucei gambiense DAL972]|eukprot:XP_011772320.1 cytochrome b5, putative [Trypanosoma brucei gambiense DAL972]
MFDYLLSLLGLLKEWPQYTLDDVRKHNDRHSLWIVAGNSVYDVTSILDSHPGGANALLQRGGGVKDCTNDFGYHSRAAQAVWASLKVGEVRFDSSEERSPLGLASALKEESKSSSKPVSPLIQMCDMKVCNSKGGCCRTSTVESHIGTSEFVPECHCADCFHRRRISGRGTASCSGAKSS